MIKIICECGVNWRTLDEAFQFIDACKQLNLFACKFQLYSEEQIREANPKIQDFLRSIMLSYEDAGDLGNYGRKIGQEVFFTPMYPEAVDFLEGFDINYYKIRFKDRYNSKIVDKVLETQKPVFISNTFQKVSYIPLNYYPIYCIPEYPAPETKYHPVDIDFTYFRGISDHTSTTNVLELYLRLLKDHENTTFLYFEKHMMLDTFTDALERDWSVTFSQLEQVLKEVKE